MLGMLGLNSLTERTLLPHEETLTRSAADFDGGREGMGSGELCSFRCDIEHGRFGDRVSDPVHDSSSAPTAIESPATVN